MKDYIGKSIIIGIVLLSATAAMAMDRSTMMLMFWGNDGTTYLTDSDGAYLTDSDGAYLTL